MEHVTLAKDSIKTILLKYYTLKHLTLVEIKLIRCAKLIESSLERLQLFKYFLLNPTASTVDSILESSTNVINILNNDYNTSERLIYESNNDKFITEDDKYVNEQKNNGFELKESMIKFEMKKLWQLYLDLTEDIKIQEVTTPALSLTPKIRDGEKQRERVKSPLANSRCNRFS